VRHQGLDLAREQRFALVVGPGAAFPLSRFDPFGGAQGRLDPEAVAVATTQGHQSEDHLRRRAHAGRTPRARLVLAGTPGAARIRDRRQPGSAAEGATTEAALGTASVQGEQRGNELAGGPGRGQPPSSSEHVVLRGAAAAVVERPLEPIQGGLEVHLPSGNAA
jgi:hypothetical protein